MKDFDSPASPDLIFKIGGEEFTMRHVRPEVLAAWEDAEIPENAVTALKQMDERVLHFLDDGNGQHERWNSLRAREENAVTMGQLRDLLEWMVEVQTARPTPAPSPSEAGRGKTAASSSAK